jgi:glucose/arabinose dehydrogenase
MTAVRSAAAHQVTGPLAVAALLGAAAVAAAPAQDKRPAMRDYDPDAIRLPPGYAVEPFATKLNFPVDVAFGDSGEVYVAEAGLHTYGVKKPHHATPAEVVQLLPNGTKKTVYDTVVPLAEVRKHDSSKDMPEGLIPPITGLTFHKGKLYVSHRSRVSVLDPKTGAFKTVVNGLPAWGEFQNNKPVFDRDGKLVFFLSTQGNSGVVEEHWMKVINLLGKKNAREVPGEDIKLAGVNYPVPVEDPDTPGVADKKLTGAFMPVGVESKPNQLVKGETVCNGAFFRCDPDGSNLERIAWGFRSCFGYRFAPDGRLVCTQNSANPMPPRGLWWDYECVYEVVKGEWYGWPDYFSGIPITDPRFKVHKEPEKFVLTEETRKKLLNGKERPRQPLARLKPHAAAEGMVFGRREFGIDPEKILVAEFGPVVGAFKGKMLYPEGVQPPGKEKQKPAPAEPAPDNPPPDVDFDWPGFKVQVVDLKTGRAEDFLANKFPGPATAGTGHGLERPIQLEWGPDGALYVVDFGVVSLTPTGMMAHPWTGAVWRVSRGEGKRLGK